MRYLPKSPAERDEMLAAIGAKSIDDLFSSIPEHYRLREALKLPGPYSEAEIIQYFKDRAAENLGGYASFLGAGVYNHLRSVITDAIIQRGEFLTSYTPYQAEISQGTLQAIFEFQTLICQLTGQEVANASMWDGSTATTEAVLMAERITRRRRVLVARSLHPEYRHVLRTYAKNSGLEVEEILFGTDGTLDEKGLEFAIRDDVAALVVQSPNFFGAIEVWPELAERAHSSGALLVVAVTEGVSLGLVRPPGEADIVALEGQSFGLRSELRRAVRRRDCDPREVRTANARAPRRASGRLRRPPGIRADPCGTRATHTPREGHFEHLHQSGALRARGYRTSDVARERRIARDGGAESFEGAFRAERAD